jgi:hypothetical protein
VLAGHHEQSLRTATAELTSAGHQALDVVCDVADEEKVAVSRPRRPMRPTNRPRPTIA